jgi:regulator of extracellular matrix RemA (YlzA/DUF370 family)
VRLVNVGYGNVVVADRVVAVVGPAAAPVRRLRQNAKEGNKLIDATEGRKTRSVIVLDSDHVLLSAVQAETIQRRLRGEDIEDEP